jgi:hypothetical protein
VEYVVSGFQRLTIYITFDTAEEVSFNSPTSFSMSSEDLSSTASGEIPNLFSTSLMIREPDK